MTLPKGWTIASLGEFTLNRVEQGEPAACAVPYIDIGSIDRDLKRVGPTVKVTRANAPTRARQWVKPGDVLVSLTRPNLNAVAIVPPELDGAVASTGFDVLRPEGVLAEWVFNRVRSQVFVSDVCAGVQGVVYPAIRPADVRRHDLPIPPAQEQQRIVDAIDSYLTRLDDAVATLERVQAKLKAYRASVLKAAVEGRLVPTEADLARTQKRAYEPAQALLARILKERRHRWEEAELGKLRATRKKLKDSKWQEKYREPMAPDPGALAKLPEGWCWTSLSTLIVDGPQNGIYMPKTQYGEGTPILRIDDYQVDWSRSSSELQRVKLSVDDEALFGLKIGDLVLNRVNSPSHLGKTLAVEVRHLPAVFESNMMRFRTSSGVLPRFLHFYLSSTQGKQRLTAGAKWAVNQASINQQDVGNTLVPLPPESEQVRLVAEIDRLHSAAGVAAATIEQDAKRSVRLRQAVLKWAFEGKLIDQDPTDEPADRLLARIRAERAALAPIKRSRGRAVKGAA